MNRTSELLPISTRLQRIAELARNAPGMAIKTLAHHIDMYWITEAYHRTRKDGAPGIDQQTEKEYSENLKENLADLHERFKSGLYKAPPVRRVHIPKGDGTKTRPIGIPTFEDKVLQRAVTMALEAVYEQDFLNCSYGFRPGRSAHKMLEECRDRLIKMGGGWVLEADIQSFFDTIDHARLREILDQRVRDGVIRRAIGKWMNAGVIEEGKHYHLEKGTPQGGVISPLLANIYLHEVLDTWFEREVKPRLHGEAHLFRYADDFIICFKSEQDAHRVMKVLPLRFERYGLKIHPEKTRLVRFQNPGYGNNAGDNEKKNGSFDLLGFTHYWSKSRRGRWMVKQKTSKKSFKRKLKTFSIWCRANRHLKINRQWGTLTSKLRGHYEYYGTPFNSQNLRNMLYRVTKIWFKWLNRRSQRKSMNWEQFNRLLRRLPLPRPRITHPLLPHAANLFPEEPDALIGHVRF